MKTLVLDLDETLVHASFKPFNVNADITLKINFDRRVNDIFVLVRPGVKEFLEQMSKHYELVLFTASLSEVSVYKIVRRSFSG
jgi:RNA polymerase II subunit A small phosphatase-like protein